MLGKIVRKVRSVFYAFVSSFIFVPSRVFHDVLYHAQCASSELVEAIIQREILPADDSGWRALGDVSKERYTKWMWSGCGMACLAMALAYFGKGSHSFVELGEAALRHGVYEDKGTEFSAMTYEPCVEFVEKVFGIHAVIREPLTIRGIKNALAQGALVMVSVNPNIRGYESVKRSQVGGHLVLVTGYDKAKEVISINNPSGFASNGSQHMHEVSERNFKRHFAGRGIVLSA